MPKAAMLHRLAELKLEHSDLDDVIARVIDDPGHDELRVRRLKKRKLLIKDQIAWLERQIDPDEPA
ncbi:MAG: YdcH family protein [Burkholderiales bacterium]|nr:YdcH family protein [Burkholderiales bacterium]